MTGIYFLSGILPNAKIPASISRTTQAPNRINCLRKCFQQETRKKEPIKSRALKRKLKKIKRQFFFIRQSLFILLIKILKGSLCRKSAMVPIVSVNLINGFLKRKKFGLSLQNKNIIIMLQTYILSGDL